MSTPFTLLTGFLGAGKTTVLNRMLSAPQGRRIAVLVNELGKVAIDGRLILSRGGDVLELAGGCVCCKIDTKNDLWDGIADVVRRSRPDAVVLETTGIAEPPAILEGLERRPEVESAGVVTAGVVCVVDGADGSSALSRREEARVQVECADRLLLSKLDLASAGAVASLHRELDAINPDAERASFPPGEEGTHALTPWLLERRGPLARPAHRHAHRQGQLATASFRDEEPLLAEPLLAAIEAWRERLFRVKGFVHLHGEARRGYLELAGGRISLERGEPWGGEAPRSELVIIGDGIDEAALRRRLWACRASQEDAS